MPTGYTSVIAEGATFEQFAWTCARAFGALIEMRDDPMDKPIPDRFEPSPYYAEKIAKAEEELFDAERLTVADATRLARQEYDEALAGNERRRVESAQLETQYRDMIAKVRAWSPPSPDHVQLKEFMIEQLQQSIEHDCFVYETPAPPLDGGVYIARKVERLRADLARYREHHAEEVERTNTRNEWIRLLRGSIPGAVGAAG